MTNSTIIGIGIDIIEIEKIEELETKDKIFTKEELDYCYSKHKPMQHLAGRWAAKEAVAKALGTGFIKDFLPIDIEILNQNGVPYVSGRPDILVSISHCENYATAMAIYFDK